MIRKDIKAKWDKFSDQELTSLKDKDHLVTQVVAKYGFEKVQAQRDVDALLKLFVREAICAGMGDVLLMLSWPVQM